MLIDALITVWFYMIQVFLGVLSPIFTLLDVIIPYDLSSSVGIVFGNAMLLDSFLPVTEFFVLAGIALSFKAAVFGYKVFWVVVHFTSYVRSFALGTRL